MDLNYCGLLLFKASSELSGGVIRGLRLNSRWFVLPGILAVAGCGVANRPAPPPATKVPQSVSAANPGAPISELKSGATSTTTAAEPPKVAESSKRASIYDTSKSGQELIAAALGRAQRDHKHILIEWGGNWCGWCHKLHDLFTHNEQVRAVLSSEFELVLVDSTQNSKLMQHYGGDDRQFSFPHLTVLDSEGHVLTNQNTEPLEQGNGHSPEAVTDFLRKWMPQKLDATVELESALKQAASQNKRVFLHVSTPACGWCKILSQFLLDHSQLLARDYIDLHVDMVRMENAKTAMAAYAPDQVGGVPWFVILDGSGKSLASSSGSGVNIGYPYEPKEVAQFIEILRTTRQSLSDQDLETLSADLMLYRSERENKLQQAAKVH